MSYFWGRVVKKKETKMSNSNPVDSSMISLSLVLITGCLTVAFLSAVFVINKELSKRKKDDNEKEDNKSDEPVVDKTQYPGGQITIFYATQTGTAEAFSNQLEREGPEHGFYITEVDMEDVEAVEQFVNEQKRKDPDTGMTRAIIIAATYGEGEPTDSSTALVQSMKDIVDDDNGEEEEKTESSSNKDILNGLEYCVFGLGNTQYEHYNAMGKFFDSVLEKLGGKRIIPIGLGDDDKDLEGDFETWKDQLWIQLKSKYLPNGGESFHQTTHKVESLPDCEYTIQYHDAETTKVVPASKRSDIPAEQVHASCRHYFTSVDCPIVVNRELRSKEDGGSTVHIEIDISNVDKDKLTYQTADNLGVLPLNDMAVVESVAKSLDYDLDAIFSVQNKPDHPSHGIPFPMPITIRECLLRYCDLTSAPRRSDLKLLANYAKDPVDKKFLSRISSKDGKKEYREKIMDGCVGIVDLLKSCPSLTIPLEHFVSICHHLLPRYYTISSSSSTSPDRIHLTVAITESTKPDGSKFNGVCSTYLAGLKPDSDNHTVRIFNRPSTFRLPKDPSRPIIMIGPGTGVAPMRALLYERSHQKLTLNQTIGKNILYFGCKKRTLDYLYEDEIQKFESDGILNELHVAFSREQTEKVYVQHLLAKNGKQTWGLLSEDTASIYVCGGVKMGHDVTEALKEIISTYGERSFDDAKDYLAKLASDGRFVQELWA